MYYKLGFLTSNFVVYFLYLSKNFNANELQFFKLPYKFFHESYVCIFNYIRIYRNFYIIILY